MTALVLSLVLAIAAPAWAAEMGLALTSDKGMELETGDTFLLRVDVTGAAELFAADIWVRFDPNLLEAVDAGFAEGDLLKTGGLHSIAKNQVDNVQGAMRFVVSFLGAGNTLNGSGTLIEISMRTRKKGIAGVAFETGASRTRFMDSTAAAYLPYQATNLTLAIGGATPEPPPPLPEASPAPGTYSGSVSVTLTGVAGGEIFYTLDGSLPVPGQAAVYTGPIELTASTTVRALCRRDGQVSGVTDFAYTVQQPSPSTGGGSDGNDLIPPGNQGTPPAGGSGGDVSADGNAPTSAAGAGGSEAEKARTPGTPPAAVQATAVILTDVQGHWAEEAIGNLASRNIIQGFPDGAFRPEEPVTRAQFALILVRVLGLEVDQEVGLAFADAGSAGSWAAPSIAAAVQAGLVAGYEDNTFRPEQEISRAEVAVMIVRAMRRLGLLSSGERQGTLPFADAAAIPGWASEEVAVAFQRGIVVGLPGNRFGSEERASRAQAATMVWRMLGGQE